jgi:hypothetical protein
MVALMLILAVLAIVVSTWYRQEHMTNKDLVSALQKMGTADDKKKKQDTPSQAKIYGPVSGGVEPPAPTLNGKNGTSTGSYPDIYGPEAVMVPGTKPSSGKQASDDTSDETYDYNPDLQKAFPTSGPPQPFLTDFSAFQK